eukprot:GHRQ01021134.1.p2 GENE.GHRQ01021134.1~~GHRQ01021134.1.p2  ORF type:complete len:103 (-),score=29.90 GHRQ01021134.1:15-323(-)
MSQQEVPLSAAKHDKPPTQIFTCHVTNILLYVILLLCRCSGETLLTLITDILDFSRIEANKLVLSAAVFSLQGVVEAAMEIAGLRAAQKRLQVRGLGFCCMC